MRKKRKRSNNNAHVHGWDDYGRQVRTALSHVECDVNEFRRLNYGPHAVCSMLQFVQVCVRRVIHVVGHNALSDVENVLVVVHTFP